MFMLTYDEISSRYGGKYNTITGSGNIYLSLAFQGRWVLVETAIIFAYEGVATVNENERTEQYERKQ